MPNYTKLTGDPSQGAVPAGEYNVLESLMGQWEALVGYTQEVPAYMLLDMANRGIQTLADFGAYASQDKFYDAYAWARVGLTRDEYMSAATIFGTEYKKVTGQDISPEALTEAFKSPLAGGSGLLSGPQYQQQLMNDVAIQKQFGWVKYGLDFSSWTQQKLSMRGAFGRDINDAEAATILQYNKTASGPNVGAIARQQGQQQSGPGVGQSIAR